MNILIAGGSGFLGRVLTSLLVGDQHQVFILTRQTPKADNQIQWDGRTVGKWIDRFKEMDAIVHLTGHGLEHWPWTKRQKQKFVDSRVIPGLVLAEAIEKAPRRPSVFLQSSGINRYGLQGEDVADESTPPGDDFLAQLAIQWENATKSIDTLGVRRIATRNAVVLARHGGLFPLMALPVRFFFGGTFGNGKQSMNWIHIKDYARAIKFLLESEDASGPYNLISPMPTSSADFMRALARTLHRPFWFHLPEWLLRILLGEMSVLLTNGRYARPKRLLEAGFQFHYGDLDIAMQDLLS